MVKRSSSKKIIGLTEPSSFTSECVSMVEDFFEANPLKLCHNNDDNLEHWLNECSSVVLAGGKDIFPMTYGQDILSGCGFSQFDIDRDIREVKVVNYCEKNNIPMLGICRGCQLLGVYNKMTLLPDISDSSIPHHPGQHQINLERGTPLHKINLRNGYNPKVPEWEIFEIINGEKQFWVNSWHHQALLCPEQEPDDIKILATAPLDDEGHEIIEIMRGNKWVACQFHPEADWQESSISRDVLNMFKEMIR